LRIINPDNTRAGMTYPSHRHDILFIRIKLHIRGDGTPQNKFEEYSNINISKDIYSVYLKSQQDKYGSSVKYGKNRYSIPSQVFNSVNNWKGGSFNYKTGMKGKSLISTGSMGGSIFWKTK